MSKKRHWTEEMFVDQSELFLPWLENRLKIAKKEAGAITEILDSNGIPKNGKVLDICCGIGRHSVELARRGYRVVGIDFAPIAIERAEELARREKVSRRVEFVIGDMRNLIESVKRFGKFNAAISMFTSFGYYGEESDLRLFREIYKVCKKNAVLILETINRDWIMKNFQSSGIETVKDLEHHEFRRFDFGTSYMEDIWKFYRMRGEEREHLATIRLDHRIYSAHELIKMLETTGWKDARAYDGLKLGSLELLSLSNRLVVVARRQ